MDRLDQIKHVGDSDPATALAMLDSLEIEMRAESEYTRNKYDLLRIRLNDKADKTATSDIVIKSLLGYFEREGTVQDKQEVCYYAGSVYRDLQDTPRALEYFFRSIEYAEDAEDCDSVMLQNTYSNLNYLYYGTELSGGCCDGAKRTGGMPGVRTRQGGAAAPLRRGTDGNGQHTAGQGLS